MARKGPFTPLVEAAKSEIEGDAAALARRLLPEPPGMQKLSRPAFLGYVRSRWAEPSFRQSLFDRVGPRNLLAIALEAHGIGREQYEQAKRGGATPQEAENGTGL